MLQPTPGTEAGVMDSYGFHADVQSLLQEISNNYGDDEFKQPSPLHSRPISDPLNARPTAPGQTPAPLYKQQQLYVPHASDPPRAHHYHPQQNNDLDAYGQYYTTGLILAY